MIVLIEDKMFHVSRSCNELMNTVTICYGTAYCFIFASEAGNLRKQCLLTLRFVYKTPSLINPKSGAPCEHSDRVIITISISACLGLRIP